MQKKFFSRFSKVALALLFVCGLLGLMASANPKSEPSHLSNGGHSDFDSCSNRTLSGEYGFTLEGTFLGVNIPFRGLVMQHYDGRGNITQVDHLVVNGVPPAQEWSPGSGTYSVNPDCTGVALINSTSNPAPINLHFVVVRHGTEIHQVVDANVAVASGVKVD